MTLTYSGIFYRNIISSYQAHMIYRIIGKRLDRYLELHIKDLIGQVIFSIDWRYVYNDFGHNVCHTYIILN